MKLRNIRPIGRYRNLVTYQECNIKKGEAISNGEFFYFYIRQNQGRVIVPEHELRSIWQSIPSK